MRASELLARWRETRDPQLADLLDRAERGRPADDWDAASVVDKLATPGNAARIDALLALPDDPRVAIALAAMLIDRTTSVGHWRVHERLAELRDARTRPFVQRLGRAPATLAILAALPGGYEPPFAALYAACYAAPDDLDVRGVLADALNDAGDPRGELFALQLAGADPDRVRQLIEVYGFAWAGAIAADFGQLRFHAGLFSGGVRHGPHVDLAEPGWRCVREIDGDVAPILPHLDALPSLRSLGPLTEAQMAALASGRPRRLERVQMSGAIPNAAPGLPMLRELALRTQTLDPACPLLPQLERLRVWGVPTLIEALAPVGGALREVEAESTTIAFSAQRDAAPGAFDRWQVRSTATYRLQFVDALQSMLRALDPAPIRALALPPLDRFEQRALADELSRFSLATPLPALPPTALTQVMFDDADAARLMPLLGELGLRFDRRRPIDGDELLPMPELVLDGQLARSDGDEVLFAVNRGVMAMVPREPRELIAWFERALLAVAPSGPASLDAFDLERGGWRMAPFNVPAGLVTALPPDTARFVPTSRLPFPWRWVGPYLVIEPPETSDHLRTLMEEEFTRQRGRDFLADCRAILGPVAASLGATEVHVSHALAIRFGQVLSARLDPRTLRARVSRRDVTRYADAGAGMPDELAEAVRGLI